MGVFDKIKNALFEEEYVEVEEKPKAKPKKDKVKREKEVKVHEKPIAKKVILPERKEEVEEDDYNDYKPKDEDFEIVPEKEEHEEFNFVDDNEFTEQNYYHEEEVPEPRIVEVVKKEETPVVEERPQEKEVSSYYSSSLDDYHSKNLYHGGDYTDNLSHEYGTYEKEKKTVFKPSPIISPIYGILDKNYKKEEIMPKREVHISSYTRERVTVDEVRRKAYGNLADDIAADINGDEKKEEPKEEVKEEDNLLVDLSDDEKPSVSSVTMGDAEEYFNDLGLEYNIDYKDSSKERATGRRVTEDYDEEEKKKEDSLVTDAKVEKKATPDPSTDDNLFDLIDSMYEDENKE